MDAFIELTVQRLWRGSLMETLGIQLIAATAEQVVGEVALRPGLEQLHGAGTFHGGVLMALADVTAAVACLYARDPTGTDVALPFAPLIQFNASLMRNTNHGKARAVAQLVNQSRSLLTVETHVRDDDGRLLLLVTSTHLVPASR
jgi:1,4-dihydroxy-2-naphthoyl-CoA hydrolase